MAKDATSLALESRNDQDEKHEPQKVTEASTEPLMNDNEAAAVLASLMHIKHKVSTNSKPIDLTGDYPSSKTIQPLIINATSKPLTTEIHTKAIDETSKNDRKRSRTEMESESMAAKAPLSESKSSSKSRDPPPKKAKSDRKVSLLSDPLQDIDWNTTKFMFIRLTYFNKRKCRRFPLKIETYSLFASFVEYYFESLVNCNWHTECDENWIESLDDLSAVRDEYIYTHDSRPFFLELMIINDSLAMKRIYAPKAVYVHNPYKCKYPPIIVPSSDTKAIKTTPVIQPKTATEPTDAQYPSEQAYYPAAAQTQAIAPQITRSSYVSSVAQQITPMQPMYAYAASQDYDHDHDSDNGYHHVTYPHYLKRSSSSSSLRGESSRMSSRNGHKRSSVISSGAICPDPTTYLPFAHAGQSTPQMRTLHKIVWVLQHQTKALTIDAIRTCLPGKKKAQVSEIDYLLSSYQSHGYTKCSTVHSRKVWTLESDAFPEEFWNRQWKRT